MRTKHLLFGAAAVTTALLLVGCGQAEAPEAGEPLQSAPTESETPEPTDDATADDIDALRATEIALEAVPGTVVDLEHDGDDSSHTWEVGILSSDDAGVEVELDRASGEVLGQSNYDLSSEQRRAPKQTIDLVIGIALGAVSGAVTEAELDSEDGRVVWEVVVEDGADDWDLEIDAESGKILKQEKDD